MGTAGAIKSEGIRVFGFGVAGDFVQVRLETGAIARIQNTGWGIAFVFTVIVFEGDFEIVDIPFADSIEGFLELETVAEEAADKQDGDQGDDDKKFDEGKCFLG